jgi:hypothetical protein
VHIGYGFILVVCAKVDKQSVLWIDWPWQMMLQNQSPLNFPMLVIIEVIVVTGSFAVELRVRLSRSFRLVVISSL